MMSKTATDGSASGNLSSGIPKSKTSEEDHLLEELRAAYQGLGREERQHFKNLMLTLSRSMNSARFRPSKQKFAQRRMRCAVYSQL